MAVCNSDLKILQQCELCDINSCYFYTTSCCNHILCGSCTTEWYQQTEKESRNWSCPWCRKVWLKREEPEIVINEIDIITEEIVEEAFNHSGFCICGEEFETYEDGEYDRCIHCHHFISSLSDEDYPDEDYFDERQEWGDYLD